MILRDRDINSGWTSAADGTLEERVYYCQNWRADVSALVTDAGQMLEWVKYSAYGVPFGLPGGDTDSDGDCDATDVSQVYTWVEGTTYDVRGDIDLDGDVDSTDSSTISSDYSGITLGRGELSDGDVWNRRGYFGRSALFNAYALDGRRRVIHAEYGRWMSRDPSEYGDGYSLYQAMKSRPIVHVDSTGLASGCVLPLPGTQGWGAGPVLVGFPLPWEELGGEETGTEDVHTVETPCQYLLRKHKEAGGDDALGLTACKDGKPFSCVYPANITKGNNLATGPILGPIVDCIKEHEAVHEGQTRCDPNAPGVQPPLDNGMTEAEEESPAYAKEIDCYNSIIYPLPPPPVPPNINTLAVELQKIDACNEWSGYNNGNTYSGCR